MKYYFMAFSLLMSASVMATDDDWDTSHSPTVQQGVYSSSDEESDEGSNEYYSPAEYLPSDEESDGEPTYLTPCSMQVLNPVSGVNFTGLTPEEQYKAMIEAIQKANPGLHLPLPKED